MSFCMGCGKQVESGDYCAECSAKMQQSQPAQVIAAETAPVQEAPAVQAAAPAAPVTEFVQETPVVTAKPATPKKKVFNGKMIAMLSVLGVFGVMTIVVGVLFN